MSERSEAEPFPHRNERRDVSEYERELDPDAEYDEPWDPPESDPHDNQEDDSVEVDEGYEDFHDRDDSHRDHSERAEQERETSRGWERHTQAGRLVTHPDDDDETDEPGERQDLTAERSGDFRNMSAEESAVHVIEAGHVGYEHEEPYTD